MITVPTLTPLPGFTFGADPELFIFNTKTKEYVCPDGIIPGTKEEPFKVQKGAVQQDGMAAEFNIDPASTFEEFDDNISVVLSELQKFLPPNHTLVAAPAVDFSTSVWEKASETAKALGCSPDFNAWTMEVNEPPHCEERPTLRTASGHLHIGWTKDADVGSRDHLIHCCDLVKQLDWYLGGWSVQADPDPTRRLLYGKAGACRFKSYGVEYRVLSNFWVMKKSSRHQVWNRMVKAILDMSQDFRPKTSEKMSRRDGVHFNTLLIESINASKRNILLENRYYLPILEI